MGTYSQFSRRTFLAAFVLLLLPIQVRSEPQTVTVFAASSLTNSLQSIAGLYKVKTGANRRLIFWRVFLHCTTDRPGCCRGHVHLSRRGLDGLLQKNGRLAEGAAAICWATG